MKIVVIGATGLIGSEVVKHLAPKHEIIPVGHSSGDHRVDISSKASIEALFKKLGAFDAVVCAAGAARFGNLDELTDDDYALGLVSKLMGQVNLVRVGAEYVSANGSFTLTSGILSRSPMPGSSAISMVNAGIEGFVRAAALEVKRGVRVNVVSPGWVKETLQAMGMDSTPGTPAAQVAFAYREAVESKRNGEVLEVKDFIRR
jgi:NAD(P)-dependent dehydrogenase (short-subunit alcohol dehydrogenase family)